MVQGYRGAGDIMLAMQRGEVHAVCMSLGQFRSHEQMFKEGKLRDLLRAEESRLAEAPGRALDLRFRQDRRAAAIDAVHLLQHRIWAALYLSARCAEGSRAVHARGDRAAVKDPELIAEAAKMKLDMVYRPPEHLEKLVIELYETPPATVEKAKQISPNLK